MAFISQESAKQLRLTGRWFILGAWRRLPGYLLIGIAAAVSIVYINKASSSRLTELENVLFQVITMGIGLMGSYILGDASAKEGAKEIVKPHARSAFRRVVSLYASLGRLLEAMSKSKTRLSDNPDAIAAIERFEGLVLEQVFTANDTIEDWGDLLPEELAELKAKSESLQPNNFKP